MAGTNPATPVVDDDKPVTEDDLRDLKYSQDGVEPPTEEDEPAEDKELADEPDELASEDDQIVEPPAADEEPEGDEPEAPTEFVKKFPNIKGDTPEEYARNVEIAYENSTTEALRLSDELKKTQPAPPVTPPADPVTPPADTPEPPVTALKPTDLYVQQKLDEEIQSAFAVTQKEYPQVSDPTEYAKFTREVATFSRTILDNQGRLASPTELYNKAAISLGWEKKVVEPDEAERLAMAAKDGAASSKTSSAPRKPAAKIPQISQKEMELNRKMYPGKTDAEIIKELAPYK